MPIRPELRKFYRGAAWGETRRRILERARNRCEQCGKPNGASVFTVTGKFARTPLMFWRTVHGKGVWVNCYGGPLPEPPARCHGTPRMIRVVLTVAHLNHVAGDDRDENLRALCQWCRLNYDKLHHKETRATRKDLARPLLQEAV